MKRTFVRTTASRSLGVLVVIGSFWQAQAQNDKQPYVTMAPLAQYMMDRNTEISLARTAAPESISRDAEIAILGPHGYETAVKGKNGFVCLVERSWMSPFDFPEFWNPKMRGPICYNAPAARSVMPLSFKRTESVLAGRTKAQIIDDIKTLVEKELPAPELGAMSYMMSSQMYLGDSQAHWHPHLMFYAPKADSALWGADLPGSPVILNPLFQDSPEPVNVFMVPLRRWSDGTEDSVHQ